MTTKADDRNRNVTISAFVGCRPAFDRRGLVTIPFRRILRLRTLILGCLLVFAVPLAAQNWPSIEGSSCAAASTCSSENQLVPSGDSHVDSQSESMASRQPTLRDLAPNIIRDNKKMCLFPIQLGKGKHLRPFLLLTAATAALVAADSYDEPYFRNSTVFDKFQTGPVRGRNMTLAVVSGPLAMYLGGLATNDRHAEGTGLLATESIADAFVADYVIKSALGRLHPSDIPVHGDFTDTWFKYPAPLSDNPGSFPSGHSAIAFAAASIFARRYPRHRWVPWAAYSVATMIALTRIPDRAHFASDVFAGAALGYVIGHVVPIPQTDAGQNVPGIGDREGR